MRYTVVFRLRGALAAAVAVEWTDAAAPEASGAGWQPCLRRADGGWRMASYGGGDAHWRAPGRLEGVAIRYRLDPAGPWSPIAADRKAIEIVAVEPEAPEPETPAPETPEARPPAPAAADWEAFAVRLASGAWTGVIVTRDDRLGPVDRVDWLGVNVANHDGEAALEPHFEPTVPFELAGYSIPAGERWWLFRSKAGAVHERPAGSALNHVRFRYRRAGGPLLSPHAEPRRSLSEAHLRAPAPDAPAPGAPLPVAPALVAAPALTGTGTIGSALALDPGTWSGEPGPEIAVEWLRNGAPIPGATATAYVPGPEDDRRDIAARVTALNAAGSRAAVTEAVRALYAAPTLTGPAEDDIVLDAAPGVQAVETAFAFAGDNLAYAAEGWGAAIDAATGRLSVPTEIPVAGERVTVTASNSGGAVSVVFTVTVEAIEDEGDDGGEEAVPPPAPEPEDWDAFAVRLASGAWTGVVVTRDDRLGPVAGVDWLGVNVANHDGDAALEPHFEPTIAFDLAGFAIPAGERWWLFRSKAGAVHERPAGSALTHLRCRYRLAEGGPSSRHAEAARSLSEARLVAPAAAATPPPAAGASRWRAMPIRSPQEKAQGLPGGEASQHPHGVWRDVRNPDLIIWGHDMGAVWHSRSRVPRWSNSGNLGLWAYMVQAVAIHPATGDWYAVGASAYDPGNRNLQGIYRKRAAVVGTPQERWELVRQIDRVGHWRWIHETITFDAQGRILVAVNRRQTNDTRTPPSYNGVDVSGNTIEEPGQIWRSPSGDAGSWSQVGDNLLVLTGAGTKFHRITGLRAHPTNANVLYMSTWNGLWKSVDGGRTWDHRSGKAGLPAGIVRNIAMNPANGEQLYVAVSAAGLDAGVGVYYSGNGGASWSQINTPAGAAISKIFASPVDFGTPSARLWLVCRRQDLRTSGNNGASWQATNTPGRPGSGVYTQRIIDGPNDWLGTILPHPTRKTDAFAFANSAPHRTENAVDWVDAGWGFTGFSAAYGASFDFDRANRDTFAMGLFDVGWVETRDDGASFRGVGPNVDHPTQNGQIHRSCYNIARLWADDVMVSTIGTQSGGQVLIRSTNPLNPNSYSLADGGGFAAHVFLRRHPGDAAVIYGQRRRSFDRGASWQNYGGGEGFVMDMNLGNPNVLYALRGSGGSSAVARSTDRGSSWALLVAVGWSINWRDVRIVTFASDPQDVAAFWTNSADRDLARWSPSTGWRTDFGIRARVAASIPGGLPNNAGGVGHIAVDPQDRNRVIVVWHYPGASKVLVTRNAWAARPDWEDMTDDLPVTPGAQAAVHPLTREVFYATNGNGTYRMPFAG